MVKKYNYCSINKIDKNGILFVDGYFIDFELCRVNWAKKNNILVDETHCVAERDITALSPYFKFYSNDDQVVVWFKKRIFFNWRKHFQKLRVMIEEAGYKTFDLS